MILDTIVDMAGAIAFDRQADVVIEADDIRDAIVEYYASKAHLTDEAIEVILELVEEHIDNGY